MFRLSIVSALLVQVVNIVLVLLLYKLFKHINKGMAVLMVVFSLVAVPIAFLNEINNLAVLDLLQNVNPSDDLISFYLHLHEQGIIIAQVFWGLWLFPMGFLAYKSGFIPKVIGVLLMVGCLGYVVDSFTLIVFPELGFTLSEFTFLGEIIFPLWLVIKGASWKGKSLTELETE